MLKLKEVNIIIFGVVMWFKIDFYWVSFINNGVLILCSIDLKLFGLSIVCVCEYLGFFFKWKKEEGYFDFLIDFIDFYNFFF